MLKTQLSVDYSDSLNSKVLRLFDTSYYNSNDKIENYLIEVLPANSKKWVTFFVNKGFSLALNSSSLRYNVVTDSNELANLPDGIYEIKQSYKPNTLTVVQYYHFRIVSLYYKIKNERTKLYANECKLSREEFIENVRKLRDIEEYADAAKFTVEEKEDKRKGLDLYQWATVLLQNYNNECKC